MDMALKVGLGKVGDLGKFIRDQRRNARLSLRKLSSMAGVSNPYLSQIERGMRRPSAEILQAIAKALRISAESLYVKAGILEERDDASDPATAILRDLTITDKQKQVLIEVYQSFRHENEMEGERSGPTRPQVKRAAAAAKAKRTAKAKRPARATRAARAKRGGAPQRTATRRPARRQVARRPAARGKNPRPSGRRNR